jgi:hypothetical protein
MSRCLIDGIQHGFLYQARCDAHCHAKQKRKLLARSRYNGFAQAARAAAKCATDSRLAASSKAPTEVA